MYTLEWKAPQAAQWRKVPRRIYNSAQDALDAASALRQGLRTMVRVVFP